ncbi:pilus assembly PilX family protein [Aliamphritea spongicola]|uniref:pilus assembly PilX family protein n=1 Tax=Aliamphritea spongicola TaxID=707589 RepID=UPI001FAF5054|nr:PilX N-terminal domain-containing pilus assembly protein [Aliamphritea spongicola]
MKSVRLSERQVRKERGATLIVTLIFLLIIVTVSMGGIQTTAMEERMANNARQRNLAFQSAEAGLREAERFIDSLTDTGGFGSVPGLLAINDNEPNYFSGVTWVDGTAASVLVSPNAVNLHSLKENPRYIIKYVTDNNTDGQDGIEIINDGTPSGGDRVAIFKIVSRGVGGNATTQVILKSNYGKRF